MIREEDHAGVRRPGERQQQPLRASRAADKTAENRLVETRQDGVSERFSLRPTATMRIYGTRDRRALKLLWYDPHHGTNARAVYLVRSRQASGP